jgi:hypothetical protein
MKDTRKKPVLANRPSQRTLAQEEALVRQAWTNRKAAKQHRDLVDLPKQSDDGRHLMVLPAKQGPRS